MFYINSFLFRRLKIANTIIKTSCKMSTDHCISFEDIKKAYALVKPIVHRTALLQCTTISKLAGKNIYLKTENFQKTGSFKIRGAINTVALELSKEQKPKCFVTHSSGNHGQALARAAQMYKIPAYIIMPSTAPQCKKDAVKTYGGIVIECIPTEEERKKTAQNVCVEKNGVFVDPSQTPTVIAGQGSMAIEMLEQNPDLDAIVIPVGGGGMISGIAIAAKTLKPSIKIYAAEPEAANDCYLSMKNGVLSPLKTTPVTIADGVKVNVGKVTWPIIRDYVDHVFTVTEDEIKMATKLVWERAKLVIEPTSGLGVATVTGDKFKKMLQNDNAVKNVAVILCGGNVDLSTISTVLDL